MKTMCGWVPFNMFLEDCLVLCAFISPLDAADGLWMACFLAEGPKWGSLLLCLTEGPWAQHSPSECFHQGHGASSGPCWSMRFLSPHMSQGQALSSVYMHSKADPRGKCIGGLRCQGPGLRAEGIQQGR